jgi:NAD(P)-dependent dehydrogenase (short-subunit alcohol dehydrogenase family)
LSWLGLEDAGVVIAGAGGLGGAVAAGFAGAGARVVLLDRDEARLADLASTVNLAGTVTADLGAADACRTALEEGAAVAGGLDVFVHCLGTNVRRPVEEYTDEELERILTLNLSSALWLGREAARLMRARGSGRMVFFSSVASILAHAHHGPYAATKGAINQWVRVMANELAPAGIAVNAVAPGYIETDLTAGYLAQPGKRDALLALIPAGRFGTVEEVVGPVLFLSSAQAGFVTGQILAIDGARTTI